MRRRVVRGPLVAMLVALALAGAWTTSAAAELEAAVLTTDVNFGTGITFHLEMPHAAAEPAGVEVRYGLPDSIVVRRSAAEFAVADGLLRAAYAWEPRVPLVVGTEVEYRFVIRSADGSEIRTAPAAVSYFDATLPWTTASEGLVEIWYYAGGEAVETDARTGIRAALDILRHSFGAELERPTRLILYADIGQMRRDLGGGTSPWVGGAAIADLNLTVLHAPAVNRDPLDLQATVAHEITHIVLEHRTRNAFGGLPAWLHEGLATTVEAEIKERFAYDDIMTRLIDEDDFVSLRGITGSFPAASQAAVNAYAQSNSLVTYIIEIWGREGIADLLEAYAGGVSDDEAVQAALGISLDELDRAWLGAHGVENPSLGSLMPSDVAAAMAPPDGEGASPARPAPDPVVAAAAAIAVIAAAATGLAVRRGRIARGYARY